MGTVVAPASRRSSVILTTQPKISLGFVSIVMSLLDTLMKAKSGRNSIFFFFVVLGLGVGIYLSTSFLEVSSISKENNLDSFNTYFLCILNYICIIQNYG